MSCAEVGRILGMSASKISRIETGHSGLQIADVAELLALYRVPAARSRKLLDQLRRGNQKGWWHRRTGLPRLWRALIERESSATFIQNYESLVIPGLLQTSEYCATMIRSGEPTLAAAELENLVASRMARQTLLTRARAPRFVAVVNEVALRIPVGGPGVMRRQLLHLVTVAGQPNIDLRVVPVSAGAHAGLRGSFMILEFAAEPGIAFVENHDTGIFLEEEGELERYRLALRTIMGLALSQQATIELIKAIAEDLG